MKMNTMSTIKPLRVGIIGASAERGWAKASHVPAVQKLAGLELAAVASGDQRKAEAAARAFGVKRAYGDARDLIRDPEIDVVTVAVKVPDHRELVLAALAAGKHVFCEWPLGRNLAETEEMASAARTAGVRTVLGLQTRANPAAKRAQEIVANGGLGRVLNARGYSTTLAFGPKTEAAMVFAEEAENGVTLVTIQGGHTLDFAVELLGPLAAFSAQTTIQYPQIVLADGTERARTIPDHLLVQGRLANGGGALVLEVAGGRPAGRTPFHLEITGEKGELLLKGGAARGFQSGRLQLSLDGEPQTVDEGELAVLPDEAVNVGGLYTALRDDLAQGTRTVVDFDDAVRLAQLVDGVSLSALKHP